MNIIEWLQNYYEGCCDEDWEHTYGIKIGTLDNPGWTVDIDLADTAIEDCLFEKIRIERDDNNWMICRVENRVFKGDGGVKNLEEILTIFRDWVQTCGASSSKS